VDASPGQFDLAEISIIEGSGVQTNPNHRWGDYSAMQIDPNDQTTFWYTQQYYETTSDRSWQTRIAAFHINDYLDLNLSTPFDTICSGEETQLFASATGGSGNYSFLWSARPGGFHSVEQNPLVSPTSNTTYFCTVNDGVNQKADSIQLIIDPCTGLMPISDKEPKILIFPNPAINIVNIRFPDQSNENQILHIYSLSGKLIAVHTYKSKKEINFDVSDYQNGVYVLQIQSNLGITTYRLLICK
jgi:hypothetical protein